MTPRDSRDEWHGLPPEATDPTGAILLVAGIIFGIIYLIFG